MFTSSTDWWMKRALSRAFTTPMPCFKSSGFISSRALSTFSTMATVLPPVWRWSSRATTSWPLNLARLRFSLNPSTMVATSHNSTGRPCLLPTMTWRKSSTDFALASTFTATSRVACNRFPEGMSLVSLLKAAITLGSERPMASSFAGSTCTWISRVLPPTTSTLPTPFTFSRRRLRKSSATRVSSRLPMPVCWPSGPTTRETTGNCEGSNLEMTGSSMVLGRSRRIWLMRVRTSSNALSTSRPNWNWIIKVPTDS